MRHLATGMLVCALVVSTHAQPQGHQQPQGRLDWPCGARLDPTYTTMAEATGGQVFLFHPSELGAPGGAVMADHEHDQTLFRAVTTLEEGLYEYRVPVDATVESVRFSVWLQCLQVVEIERPSGALLQASDPGIEHHAFQAGRVVIVRAPPPGSWRVVVSGRGLLSLVVQGRTELSLDSVAFQREGGRPGHEGLFRIQGSPRAGVPQLLRIGVSGRWTGVQARLATAAADDLQPLRLRPLSESDTDREYVADVTLRPAAFRVVVSGTDGRGFPVQRVHAPLLEAIK